jgi:hypothetical protein
MVKQVPIHRAIRVVLAGEDPSTHGAESPLEAMKLRRERQWHRDQRFAPLLVRHGAP